MAAKVKKGPAARRKPTPARKGAATTTPGPECYGEDEIGRLQARAHAVLAKPISTQGRPIGRRRSSMRDVVGRLLPEMPKTFALTTIAFGMMLERLLSRGSVDVETDARKMLVELEDEELRRAIVHYVTTTAFGRTAMVFMSGQHRGCPAETWTTTVKEATILWSAAKEDDLRTLGAFTKALDADLDALPVDELREAAAAALQGNPWPPSMPCLRGRPVEVEFLGYMRELAAERLAPDEVVAGKRRNRREAAYASRIAAKRVDGRWSERTIEKYIGAVVKEVPIPKGANNTLVVSRFAPLFDDPLDERATRELGMLTAARRAARSRG